MTLKLVYSARALTHEKAEADSVLREMHEVGAESYSLGNVLGAGPNKSREPFSHLPWLIAASVAGEFILFLLSRDLWMIGNLLIAVIALYLWPSADDSKVK